MTIVDTKMTTNAQMVNGEPNVHDKRSVPRTVGIAKIEKDEQKLDDDNGNSRRVPRAPRQNP